MKQKVFWLLAVVFAIFLTSCAGNGNDEPIETEPPSAPITLIDSQTVGYRVIRPDMTTDPIKNAAAKMKNALIAATGAQIGIGNDFDVDPSEEALEILIGATNRPESQTAIAALKDGEYVIALVNQKTLVITGKDERGTVKAVNEFLRQYLLYDQLTDTYGVKALIVPDNLHAVASVMDATITPNPDGTITLINSDPTDFRIVYPANAPATMAQGARNLGKAINSATKSNENIGVKVYADNVLAEETGAYEILIGNTNRSITAAVEAEMGENEYVIRLIDNRTIVILGSSDFGTEKALRIFTDSFLPYDYEEETYMVNHLSVPQNLNEVDRIHDPEAFHNLGLQVREDGTITLGGKEYQAVGVNWHGAFDRIYYHANETDMDKYFATLRDNGIPYARIMMGVFYANEYKEYAENTEAYFAAMDRLVQLAEKYEVGLICSMMWAHGALWEYCKEPVTALADENSKTIQFAKKYVTDVITRYRTSPAIWAWEIGNEGNLDADILSGMSTKVLNTYYTIIGKTMYELDASRLLTGGDSYPRSASNSLRDQGTWSPEDTREDVIESFALYTPYPLNCVSVHIYCDGNDAKLAEDISDFRAKTEELKIGGFVGEFGPGSYLFDNPLDKIGAEHPSEAKEQEAFKGLVDQFVAADVQIFCAWSYGRYIQQSSDGTSIEYGMLDGVYQNAYIFEYMRDVNAKLSADGKNCSADYWKAVKEN